MNKAEPALIEAQKAVKGIKKKDLEEIKALGKPPALVKMTLEAVCFLLKGKKEVMCCAADFYYGSFNSFPTNFLLESFFFFTRFYSSRFESLFSMHRTGMVSAK